MKPRPGELVVRGEARREIEPERAIVWLTVASSGAAPHLAMDALAPRAAALDAVLDEHARSLRNRVTSSLDLRETVEHDPRSGRPRVVGYEASRVTTIDVVELGALPALLRATVDGAEARLRGPSWQVPDEHPVHDEVRMAAAVDARRRADAYATGLGITLGGVEWLRDASVSVEGRGAPVGRALMASAAPAPIEVDAGRVTIAAAVDVAFRLLGA